MDYPAALELTAPGYVSPQSQLDPAPTTQVQAARIVCPTKLTLLTGATQIANIGTLDEDNNVVPMQLGYHELVLIPGTGSTLLTSGNIATATELTVGVPNFGCYNPVTGKYYFTAGALT